MGSVMQMSGGPVTTVRYIESQWHSLCTNLICDESEQQDGR
jgi:hypothetical protein